MKTILLCLLIVPVLSFSQSRGRNNGKFVSTSNEEYTFLTSGYEESILKGMDVKRDYSMIDKETTDNERGWVISFAILHHDPTNEDRAISIIVKRPKSWKDAEFFCIPFNNDELFYKFWDQYKKLNDSQKDKLSDYIFFNFADLVEKYGITPDPKAKN